MNSGVQGSRETESDGVWSCEWWLRMAGGGGDGWSGGVGGGGVRERVLVNGANVGNDGMKKVRRAEMTETRGRGRQRESERLL